MARDNAKNILQSGFLALEGNRSLGVAVDRAASRFQNRSQCPMAKAIVLDNKMRPECIVDNCSKPNHAQGMCQKHYSILVTKGTKMKQKGSFEVLTCLCGDTYISCCGCSKCRIFGKKSYEDSKLKEKLSF